MRTSAKLYSIGLFFLFLTGCGGKGTGGFSAECSADEEGTSISCTCEDGSAGVQECTDGVLGTCNCLSLVSGINSASQQEEETTSEGGEPEGGEPEGGEPEGGEPEGGEPEGGDEPEGGEPEGGEPEGGDEPEGGAPEGGEPEGGAPEGGEPEGGAPEGGEPEGGEPEGGEPEGGEPEGGEPEGGEPEGGEPEGGEPEGGEPEGGEPEGGEPEGGEPEGGEPEGGAPEGGEPEGGEPEGGEPEGGEPEGGEPEGGEPEGGEPEGGEPEGGEPEGGEPEGGEPEGGEPEGGEPEGGEPEGGEPEGGEPEGGEPEGGEPEGGSGCTEPIEWECLDDTTAQQCDQETGDMIEEKCSDEAICQEGECKPIVCLPGSLLCVNEFFIETCNGTGTGYSEPVECPPGDGNYTYCDSVINECVSIEVECPTNACTPSNGNFGFDCIPEYAAAGTLCNDGANTTLGDVCDGAGGCAGEPYDCPTLPCKAEATQDGVACQYNDLPNGESCNDGSNETANDFCSNGACTGIPIICAGGPCLGTGTANGLTCDYEFLEAGAPCADGNIETGNDMCDGAGNCAGTPIDCSQPGPCTETFVPNGTGCTATFFPEGTPCDDGYAFTANDTCDAEGFCVGKEAICSCSPLTGTSVDSLLCAMEIDCLDTQIVDAEVYSPSGDNISNARKAINQLGNNNNDLKPKAGTSYAIIGSGPVDNTNNNQNLNGGSGIIDPFDTTNPAYDVVEFSVELTAPEYALGFSIDYVFLSVEFDEYVGTQFNDKFYIFLEAPSTTGGNKEIINFTDCRNPGLYFDLDGEECPLDSGYCCYIAINTALSECCWYQGCPDGTWTTDISGTGFSCANNPGQELQNSGTNYGSSTGWLRTSWPIEAGETFTLTFHIHDTADNFYDSEVILDNFQWITETVIPPGGEGGGVEGGEGGGEGEDFTGGTISLD